jgi:hypothetical protein
MTSLPLSENDGGNRFPGFDVFAQSRHWDNATREAIYQRVAGHGPLRFFSNLEGEVAGALFDQLLDQRAEPRVPVLELIDARLARDETDGWRYETMPMDPDAWRRSLAALDADAHARRGASFAALEWAQQAALIQSVQDLADAPWHAMPATQVWSLWTRYACTAFYGHPSAWQEMGFAGPAYPRGYKNIGVDRLESFEVKDQHPGLYQQAKK